MYALSDLHIAFIIQTIQRKEQNELISIWCMCWNIFESTLVCAIELMVFLCLLSALLFDLGPPSAKLRCYHPFLCGVRMKNLKGILDTLIHDELKGRSLEQGSSSHRGQQFSGTCALIGSSIQGTHLTFKPCSSPLVGLKLLLLRGGNCKQALPIGKKMPIKNNTASFSFQTKKLV